MHPWASGNPPAGGARRGRRGRSVPRATKRVHDTCGAGHRATLPPPSVDARRFSSPVSFAGQVCRRAVFADAVTPEWLITFAVTPEAAALRRQLGPRAGLRLLLTGMGPANARRALADALAERQPGRVITSGFAGGLNPGLTPGTVVFEADPIVELQPALLAANALPGRFHCVQRVASTAREKRSLWQATGADAVEMESAVIRRLCSERGIPCATVRVISDAADEDLPLDFNRFLTDDLRLNYARLAVALARSPGKIRRLLRFQRRAKAAAERLAAVLLAVLPVEAPASGPGRQPGK